MAKPTKTNLYDSAKRNFFKPMQKVAAAQYAYNNLEYRDQKKLIRELPATFGRFFHIQKPLPNSYAEFFDKVQFVPDELMKGIGCLVNQLLPFGKELNFFVDFKRQYESCFLKGEYGQCSLILDKIDSICLSIWSLEKRILLAYIQDGAKAALEKKDEIAEQCSIMLKLLLPMLWTKIEAKYSLSPTEQCILLSMRENGMGDQFAAYYKYLVLKGDIDYDMTDCMWLVLMTSIIDIYEFCIDAIVVAAKKKDPACNMQLRPMLADLSKTIIDNRFESVKYYLGFVETVDEQDEHAALINKYRDGEYLFIYEQALDLIQRDPSDFTIVDIYVKSAIFLNKDKISTEGLDPDTIISRIIKNYFHFMKKDEQRDVAHSKLKVMANQMSSLKTGNCLMEILRYYESSDYLLDGYCMYSEGGNIEEDEAPIDDVLDGKNRYPVFIKQKAISKRFSEYVGERQDVEAIGLYLNAYFENFLNVDLIDTKALLKRHELLLAYLEAPALETSVFYALTGAPHYMVYHFFKRYIKEQPTQIPSELMESFTAPLSPIMECFFFRVCAVNTIKDYVMMFPNSDKALEERLKILTQLSQIHGKKEYLDEITIIKRRQNVNKRVQKLDQRMIYVDEMALKETELDNVKRQFLVYKETENTLETQQFILETADLPSAEMLNSGELKIKTEKVVYKNLLFRQMFMEIRKQFLTSYKYGLDFYLSTRIRHGTLLTQMRKAFESNRLVTNKNNKVYKDDSVITDRVLHVTGNTKAKVQKLLKDFSQEIDEYILFIKNEIVQVQAHDLPEQHPDAIFNFDEMNSLFDVTQLYLDKLCNITDYVEFIEIVFAYLWKCTEIRLEKMREYLDGVKEVLSGKIAKLENDIVQIVGENPRLDVFLEMTKQANMDLNESIENVKKWFYRGKCDDDDFLIRDVIDACKESVSIHRNVNFEPIIEVNSDTLLKGECFRKASDLILIFFNNILDYDGLELKDADAHVKVVETGSIIEITISNRLNENDIPKRKDYIEKLKDKMERPDYLKTASKDKGSGHAKAYTIIHNMLPNDKSAFVLDVDKGMFVVKFRIDTTYWKAYEDTNC